MTAPEDAAAFEAALDGRPVAQIGYVTEEDVLRVRGLAGDVVIDSDIAALLRAWQGSDVM